MKYVNSGPGWRPRADGCGQELNLDNHLVKEATKDAELISFCGRHYDRFSSGDVEDMSDIDYRRICDRCRKLAGNLLPAFGKVTVLWEPAGLCVTTVPDEFYSAALDACFTCVGDIVRTPAVAQKLVDVPRLPAREPLTPLKPETPTEKVKKWLRDVEPKTDVSEPLKKHLNP